MLYNNLGEYVFPQIKKFINLLNHKLDKKLDKQNIYLIIYLIIF